MTRHVGSISLPELLSYEQGPLEILDTVPRQGWLLRGIPKEKAETVREHSERVARAAFLMTQSSIAYHQAIVHDWGEVDGIDTTPVCAESSSEKHAREWGNVQNIASELPEKASCLLIRLWQSYEQQNTPRAVIVKQLDKADAVMRAMAYDQEMHEGRFPITEEFIDTARPKLDTVISNIVERMWTTRRDPQPIERYLACVAEHRFAYRLPK